jgi:cardiolipin synthase (CMP-forming)
MNLACSVTSIRFILAPLIFWQLTSHTSSGVIWMFILLILAGGTDVADGWVARVFHQVSELGKALDPLADKLVIFFTMFGLTWWGLPVWFIIVYLAKEGFQVLAGLFLFRKCKKLIPSNFWGKSATVFFFSGFGLFFWSHRVGMAFIILAMVDSIYALFTYYQAFTRIKHE